MRLCRTSLRVESLRPQRQATGDDRQRRRCRVRHDHSRVGLVGAASPVALPGWSRRTWRRWVVGRLTGIDTVLLDLDGTLYVGSRVVPGAPEAVRWLRAQGLTVRFTTNPDSIPPAGLADRLARLGFPAAEDEL